MRHVRAVFARMAGVFTGHRADDDLRAELAFLSQAFADDARTFSASEPKIAERRAKQYAAVLKAIDDVERNVQPALEVEAMMVRLRAL